MKRYFVPLILFSFSSVAFSEPVLNVNNVVGKTKAEVAKVIGNPLNCEKSKYGSKCTYSKGESEIVFIKGKADWITIEAIDHIPFNISALESIGLPKQKADFKNNYTLRWSGINGLYEVSIFKGNKNSDYAYIKAVTK